MDGYKVKTAEKGATRSTSSGSAPIIAPKGRALTRPVIPATMAAKKLESLCRPVVRYDLNWNALQKQIGKHILTGKFVEARFSIQRFQIPRVQFHKKCSVPHLKGQRFLMNELSHALPKQNSSRAPIQVFQWREYRIIQIQGMKDMILLRGNKFQTILPIKIEGVINSYGKMFLKTRLNGVRLQIRLHDEVFSRLYLDILMVDRMLPKLFSTGVRKIEILPKAEYVAKYGRIGGGIELPGSLKVAMRFLSNIRIRKDDAHHIQTMYIFSILTHEIAHNWQGTRGINIVQNPFMRGGFEVLPHFIFHSKESTAFCKISWNSIYHPKNLHSPSLRFIQWIGTIPFGISFEYKASKRNCFEDFAFFAGLFALDRYLLLHHARSTMDVLFFDLAIKYLYFKRFYGNRWLPAQLRQLKSQYWISQMNDLTFEEVEKKIKEWRFDKNSGLRIRGKPIKPTIPAHEIPKHQAELLLTLQLIKTARFTTPWRRFTNRAFYGFSSDEFGWHK